MTPDAHGIAVLVLTILALFLFTRDRIPLESSSLAILIILVVGFELVPYYRDGARALQPSDFFLGFGNEALIAICALMMVGKALETTGALQPLANVVGRAWSSRPVLALVIDDLGWDAHAGDRVLELPAPITVAVLPGTPSTHRLAVAAGRLSDFTVSGAWREFRRF